MKRKYEYIVVVLLAILLMLLASCRSKRVAIVEKLDSVAIHNVSLEDSIRSDVSFSFEEMMVRTLSPALPRYGEGDSVQSLRMVEVDGRKVPVVIREVRVVNGRFEKCEQEVKKKQVCDSLNVSSEKHTSPLSPPPKPNCWFIIGMMIGVIIIIIASRARS